MGALTTTRESAVRSPSVASEPKPRLNAVEMPDPKPLRVVAAFGRQGAKTTLLAAHPDEFNLPNRRPAPNRRTLLLELAGSDATFVDEHEASLSRAWLSANGTAYCSALQSTTMHLCRGGVWTTEELSPTPVPMVANIFGFSGETSDEDIVFATSPGKLFVRRNGQWTAHLAPNDMKLGSVHGRDPNDMFVGGEQLLHFDGTRLEEYENPDHSVRVVRVTEDDRLIGGWDLLSIATTANGSWEPIDGIKDVMDLTEWNGQVYAGTFDAGVFKVYPGTVTSVSPAFGVTELLAIDSGLIAMMTGVARVFDGKTWQQVRAPVCEVGKRPK